MVTDDLMALLDAFAADGDVTDALIADLDRRYLLAKRGGTLPDTGAPFARFLQRQRGMAGDTCSVVVRRYLMATGCTSAQLAQRTGTLATTVDVLMALREPFDVEDVGHLAGVVAHHTGEQLAVLHRLLKEVAAHHVARVSRAPALLAARQRRPT